MTPRMLRIALLIALAVALSACRGATPPVNFYSLPSLAPSGGAPEPAAAVAVGVGPLEIPRAIDRPHIMTRDGKDRLHVSELHRWGGALEADTLRAITANLGALLNSPRVVAYPWTGFIDPQYRVPVTIHRLDGTLGGEVVLDATWGIIPKGATEAALVHRTLTRVTTASPDYDALIAAHGQLLEALSEDIATAIRHLASKEQ